MDKGFAFAFAMLLTWIAFLIEKLCSPYWKRFINYTSASPAQKWKDSFTPREWYHFIYIKPGSYTEKELSFLRDLDSQNIKSNFFKNLIQEDYCVKQLKTESLEESFKYRL